MLVMAPMVLLTKLAAAFVALVVSFYEALSIAIIILAIAAVGFLS